MTVTNSLLERYANQRQALRDINHDIATGKPLAEIMEPILSRLCKVVGAGGARVIVTDDEADSFGAGEKAQVMSNVDGVLWGFLKQRVVVPNVSDAPPNLNLSALEGVARSLVTIPLEAYGSHQGILWVGFDHEYSLQDDEYEFVEMVATEVATLIATQPQPGISLSGIEVTQVMAGANDALIIMDNDGNIQLMNPAAQALFALDEDAIGTSVLDAIEDVQLKATIQGQDFSADIVPDFVAADGRSFKPSVSPIMGRHGLQIGKLLIMWEISRYKRMNENMSMFLHTVSHDLRSPLTAAKGFLDMLGMVGELNEKQVTFIGKILTSINDMTNLVEKVLDAGRLDPEMGTYQLRRELVDPAGTVQKVASTLANAASKKTIELVVDVADNLPVLNLDPMMIERALVNLVENAIKYTPDNGKVFVGGRVEQSNLILFVKDNGPGIPLEDQERLFLKGERLTRKGERNVRGSGLGLYIVKNVAQQHGGDAKVNSKPGDGSEFYLEIPIAGPNMLGAATD